MRNVQDADGNEANADDMPPQVRRFALFLEHNHAAEAGCHKCSCVDCQSFRADVAAGTFAIEVADGGCDYCGWFGMRRDREVNFDAESGHWVCAKCWFGPQPPPDAGDMRWPWRHEEPDFLKHWPKR